MREKQKLFYKLIKQRKNREENEKGMIVVEAVLTFTVFIMVVVAIIYLINIFIVHNKVQFAINSTAHELASYSYLYDALGVRAAEQQIASDGNKYTAPIDETTSQVIDSFNKMNTLRDNVEQTADQLQYIETTQDVSQLYEQAKKVAESGQDATESINKSVSDVTNLFSDPKSLMLGVIYLGASAASYETKSAGARIAAGAMVGKYISDEELKSYGVTNGLKGLDFSGTTMFCDEKKQLIDIVVQYDVDLEFIGFIFPKDSARLHVVQRVTVPAWLNGDGQEP